MPSKILFRDAQGREGVIELRGEPVWVGRAMECAIRTDDAMVSRKHSMIRFEQGRYWVEDLGSSNGTHVNDVKVQKQALNHNDVVRCGSMWLRYVEEGGQMFAGGGGTQAAPPLGRTQMVGGPTDFGFQSTVAAPRNPTQGVAQGGLSPTGFGSAGGGRSVVVDMGDSGDAARYRQQADELRSQYEMVRAERDKEVAENKRLRAENSNLSSRVDDLKTQMKESEEVILSLKRVAEDMREETTQIRERDHKMQAQVAEAQEDLQSRTRQLQRANDDIAKLKQEIDNFKKQVFELTRMKDDGFKKLNDQLAEVEHLREVIREQERMLEERRVGLISLEEALKELRADRETRIKEMAQLKAERDEVRIGFNRLSAKEQATDDENRRLGRLMQELQSGGGERELARLSGELRETKADATRLQSEVTRLEKDLKATRQEADKLLEARSKAEAGNPEDDRIKEAEAQQRKAEEARVKSESARLRAEDEKNAAMKLRDEIAAENAGLKKRLSDLQEQRASSGKKGDENLERRIDELSVKLEEAEHKAQSALKRYDESEDKVRALQRELQGAKRGGGSGGGGDTTAMKERAAEVYQSINDVMSELRVNISVVKDEFDAFVGKNPDARSRTIRDAIEAAAGQTEDVKGVLRALREMAEV